MPSVAAIAPKPTATVIWERAELYPAQEEALFAPERYAVVEASTKAGKTVGCIIWLLEQAFLGRSGHNYWWVAPIYAQAKIAYRRMKRMLPNEVYTANESELSITLLHGAVLVFKGAEKPDSLYGEDVYAAVMDEATRCKEEAWHALRSTLTATRGPVRIIGNVKGRKNWAYRLARRAEAGDPAMHYARLTAYDAIAGGVLDAAEIEDAKRHLPPAVFEELYLAVPSDDGGNPFGLDAIRACRVEAPSKQPTVVYGIDLGKSQDWTWIVGLDAAGHQTVSRRYQRDWESTTDDLVRQIGRTPAVLDDTGVGNAIAERVQARCPNAEGFTFTQASKQQLMGGLRQAIQSTEVGLWDEALISELETFEYEHTRTGVRYTAPPGLHDDGVCALALARYGLGQPRPMRGRDMTRQVVF